MPKTWISTLSSPLALEPGGREGGREREGEGKARHTPLSAPSHAIWPWILLCDVRLITTTLWVSIFAPI